jgi:hypothetical protein
MTEAVVIVSFGGGVDSTAMLVGLHARKVRPDAILFADTGGELPEVYQHVDMVGEWCEASGFPSLQRVRYESERHSSLEDECINNETLPSKAFGNGGCSVKWKRQPIDKWIKESDFANRKRLRLIGINFDEVRRGQIPNTELDEFVYPLREWRWGRRECNEICQSTFGYTPHKSACFYCPAMKKKEVIQLSKSHPDLFNRAVEMERNAAESLTTVKGLGRNWSWEGLVKADASQARMMFDVVEPHCLGECDT